MEKMTKLGDKDAKHGLDVLHKLKSHLESFQSARTAPVSIDDRRFMDDMFLLSEKPVMYVCNVDDVSATKGNDYSARFIESVRSQDSEVLVIAAKMESEIAELDNEEDRLAFLAMRD